MQSRKRLTRKVFYALLAALLWAGFVVDGSHAIYTDQVQLTGNSLTSGTTNLLISNSQNASSTIFEKTRTGFSESLSPGQSYDRFFLIKNGSSAGVDYKLSLASVTPQDIELMAAHTRVTIVAVDSEGAPTGAQYSTILSVIKNTPGVTPFIIPAGITQRFKITVKLEPSFSSPGSLMNYDLLFNGTQETI